MANGRTQTNLARHADAPGGRIGLSKFTGGFGLGRLRSRGALPFRAVNRREAADYDPGLQRHHLLPRQLLAHRCFAALFDQIGPERIGFDDFRSNGLLLPASDAAALRIGLPLHRGPHRDYNAMVMERVGQVEGLWSRVRLRAPEVALHEAVARLGLLQRALRRRLLDPVRKRFLLNRHDPHSAPVDFGMIDAFVDSLWATTEVSPPPPPLAARFGVERLVQRMPTRSASPAFAC